MAKKKRRKRAADRRAAPDPEGEPGELETLSVRVSAELVAELRLAAAERRNARVRSWSQQGMVEEAVEAWLERRG